MGDSNKNTKPLQCEGVFIYNFYMYYIYGNEDYLKENKISELIHKFNPSTVLHFNSDTKIGDIINQISTFSLFDSSRLLIFRDLSYFTKDSSEVNALIKSLQFKPESTIVVFTSDKINNKNKTTIVEYLLKNSKTFEFNELSEKEIVAVAKSKITSLGASISNVDLYYFLSKVPNRLSLIINEIEKLVSLDKNISKSNIDDLIQKYDLGSAFDFINSFHNGNIELLFKSYYEKINQGETIQSFISQITNVLEICSRIHSLKKVGHTDKEIEKILDKHSFVIKKNSEFLNTIGYKKVCKYLNMISEIDVKIKKGILDEKIGFERFLLETIKY